MTSADPTIPHKQHWCAKIRMRTLRGYHREAQGYIAWDEYQLVAGRKILSRHETLDQAVAAVEKMSK